MELLVKLVKVQWVLQTVVMLWVALAEVLCWAAAQLQAMVVEQIRVLLVQIQAAAGQGVMRLELRSVAVLAVAVLVEFMQLLLAHPLLILIQ
jgi:hypothetical protein